MPPEADVDGPGETTRHGKQKHIKKKKKEKNSGTSI